MNTICFDNNATTPLDSRVREKMLPWLGEHFGNPSSIHAFGRDAKEAVEEARSRVAALIGARAEEVVFTGSGTEANNAVLQHVARSKGFRGHFVISALEHPSIRVAAEELRKLGIETTIVDPPPSGVVEREAVVAALRPDTSMVCLMSANNEIGTLQPVTEVGEVCRERDVWLHCDAVQSVGKEVVDVGGLLADTVTVAAHKFHGPLGAAALWLRSGAEMTPLLVGGAQERRLRASTENVPALVGFGEAARIAGVELDERRAHLRSLQDRFESGVLGLDDVRIHCSDSPRLASTSHVAFLGVEAEALLIRLDLAGYAVSTGSACASGAVEPSPVLLAMGIDRAEALASLRISFGMTNSQSQVDDFLAVLAEEVGTLRRIAPSRRS